MLRIYKRPEFHTMHAKSMWWGGQCTSKFSLFFSFFRKIREIQFLSRVSILLLTRDIDIVILSVCLSVTRWYCMKTA